MSKLNELISWKRTININGEEFNLDKLWEAYLEKINAEPATWVTIQTSGRFAAATIPMYRDYTLNDISTAFMTYAKEAESVDEVLLIQDKLNELLQTIWISSNIIWAWTLKDFARIQIILRARISNLLKASNDTEKAITDTVWLTSSIVWELN